MLGRWILDRLRGERVLRCRMDKFYKLFRPKIIRDFKNPRKQNRQDANITKSYVFLLTIVKISTTLYVFCIFVFLFNLCRRGTPISKKYSSIRSHLGDGWLQYFFRLCTGITYYNICVQVHKRSLCIIL